MTITTGIGFNLKISPFELRTFRCFACHCENVKQETDCVCWTHSFAGFLLIRGLLLLSLVNDRRVLLHTVHTSTCHIQYKKYLIHPYHHKLDNQDHAQDTTGQATRLNLLLLLTARPLVPVIAEGKQTASRRETGCRTMSRCLETNLKFLRIITFHDIIYFISLQYSQSCKKEYFFMTTDFSKVNTNIVE